MYFLKDTLFRGNYADLCGENSGDQDLAHSSMSVTYLCESPEHSALSARIEVTSPAQIYILCRLALTINRVGKVSLSVTF